LPDNVIYRNDFTTRESASAIPRIGETYTATPYPETSKRLYTYLNTAAIIEASTPCFLLNGYHGYLNFMPSYRSDIGDSRPSYDGWFQPDFSKGSATSSDNLFRHTAVLYYDNSNPCFRFVYPGGTSAQRTGIALKSLRNTFTNGQLRIQVDIKVPGEWSKNDAQFWVFPVYDKYMSIEAWGGDPTVITNGVTPGMFGCRSGDNLTRPYLQYWNAKGNTQFGNNYDGNNRMLWSRYTVTYDLDTGRMSGTCESLSEWVSLDVATNVTDYSAVAHPTFDSVPNDLRTNAKVGENNYFIGVASAADMADILAERGGISGIGAFIGRVGNSARNGTNIIGGEFAAAKNKPLMDNIRVSWKAPGASDFVVAYEDDFTTRTYTTFCAPDVGTNATYAAGTESTGPLIDLFTGYAKGHSGGSDDGYDKFRLVPKAVKPYDTTLQPLGIDGWRRLVPFSDGMNGDIWTRDAYDAGVATNLLEIGRSGQYSCIANLIGEEITSGKVRISVDVHTPRFPASNVYLDEGRQRVAVALGPTSLYSSLTADVAGNTLAGGGFFLEIANAVTNRVAFTYGTGATLTEDRTVVIDTNTWYRLELMADLDDRTYDMTIAPLGSLSVIGDFVPTNDVVMTATGIPFASDSGTGIGAFYLWGYGYGGSTGWSKENRTAFDNIRIWKIAEDGGTATTNLVYSNDFDTRARILSNSVRASGRLAYQYDRDDGQDHWIRKNGAGDETFGADATVRDDAGNQFLSLGRESGDGHTTHYTTSLGQSVSQGKFTISADMRPPLYWFGRASGSMMLSVGNKLMEQNQVKDVNAGMLLRFGFKDSTGSGNGGRYDDICPFAIGSSDGTPVGTAIGTYSYMGDSVKGAANWYRFVAKVNLDDETFDVKVYDMGATHPTPETPCGTLVGSVSGLHLMNPLDDGISSLEVSCFGVTSTFGETGVDPLHALIDNITVYKPQGLIVVVF